MWKRIEDNRDDSTRKENFAMSGIEEVNERKIFEGAEDRLTH